MQPVVLMHAVSALQAEAGVHGHAWQSVRISREEMVSREIILSGETL